MPKPSYSPEELNSLISNMANHFNTNVVTTKQIEEYTKARSLPMPWAFMNNKANRKAWGKYRVSGDITAPVEAPSPVLVNAIKQELAAPQIKTLADSFIPERDPVYVPFGFYNDLRGIIESRIFYPVYITGQSGNGKTLGAEQACAELQRELIRVNITKETDETDLIGSYELIDGNTVWRDGPVLVAMKRGAILLLDETDYGSERLLCLQPVLEGKGYFNKKRGEFITPASGFNIIATANTKGKGSDDGRFIGANVLNEAFLERFAITVEQEYPSLNTEIKILTNLFTSLNKPSLSFATNLAKWAELIRKTYKEGGVDEVISTRRLTHIARAYVIWNNKRKAIELCLNRFDDEVKTVYLDFYTKIDAKIDEKETVASAPVAPKTAPVDPGAFTPNPAITALRSASQQAMANQKPATPVTPQKPVTQPAAKPVAPSKPVNTPKPAAGGSTSTNLIKNAMNIATLSVKYKTAIKVSDPDDMGMVTVTSHGQTSVIPGNDSVAQRDAKTALESVVMSHAANKNMSLANTSTGDDDEDVPF
jgi:MoxR-like ATPase